MKTYITVSAIAYLLGSIPFGYILVRRFLKQDIRQSGSGNIGATNVARSGAKGLAIATLALDAGKGYLAVYFARALYFKIVSSRLRRLRHRQSEVQGSGEIDGQISLARIKG